MRGVLVASFGLAVLTAACGSSPVAKAPPPVASLSSAGSSSTIATDSGDTRQVGACTVKVSVSAPVTPYQSNDNATWSESYDYQCPTSDGTSHIDGSEATLLSIMNGTQLTQDGGSAAGDGTTWASRENQYLTARPGIVGVRLVRQTTGQALLSVEPVWSASLHVGFTPLIWSGDQRNLVVQAVGISGNVIASEPWDLPSSSSGVEITAPLKAHEVTPAK